MAYFAGGVSDALRGEGDIPGEPSGEMMAALSSGQPCAGLLARRQAGVRLETFQVMEHEQQ